MTAPKLRPSFTIDLAASPDEAIRRIRAGLRANGLSDCSMSAGRCAELFVERSRRRFWSPYLSIQLEEKDEGSLLRGRFAPHPEVWTLFAFLYAAVGFGILVGAGWGYAQWVLGRSPWGLLLIPAGALLIAALHGASVVGQRLGAEQMDELGSRLKRVLETVPGAPEASFEFEEV